MTLQDLEQICIESGAELLEVLGEMEATGEIEEQDARLIQMKIIVWERELMELSDLARRHGIWKRLREVVGPS